MADDLTPFQDLSPAGTILGTDGVVISRDGETLLQGTVASLFTSPALTGTPTGPTAAPGTATTQLATTAFVAARADVNNDYADAAALAAQSAAEDYANDLIDGRSWKQPVRAATTTTLPANNYSNGSSGVGATLTGTSNGALSAQDGVTLVAADALLVKNEASAEHNGIYTLTQVGDGSHPYILTRRTDADTSAKLLNATVKVGEGTDSGDKSYTGTADAPITVGSTALPFALTSTTTTYTADESTIHLSGTTFSLKAGAVGIDIHAATGKTTPADADELGIVDSAASNVLKKVTWANVKATLKAYFDTLYAVIGAIGSSGLTMTTARLLGRTTASTGAVEEITVGTGLSMASTTLRVAPSVQTVTSSATVTPTFTDDAVKVTAQAAALALANPTGTAVPMHGIVIRIKDNGTARAISYDTQYRAIGITLPTTTVISKTTYLAMIYNSDDTKWDVVATGTEA